MTISSHRKLEQQAKREQWQAPPPIASPGLSIDITNAECTGCNLCVLACPTGVLALEENIKLAYVVRLDTCIVCRSCEVVCKPDCIHVKLESETNEG